MNNYYQINIKPRFRDTDGLTHVNNAVYLTYLEIARSEWFMELFPKSKISDFNFIIARVEIDYKYPITLDSNIKIIMQVSRIGTKSWDFEYRILDGEIDRTYAHAKTVQVFYDYKNNQTINITSEIQMVLKSIQK